MAKINHSPPAPLWPWGGPRSVRERLVEPGQLDRKKKAGKKGDPKNPALASAALLEFIGPAHSSEELRLPIPPHPDGHDADLEGFQDRQFLQTVAKRNASESRRALDRGLARLNAPQDRIDRLRALVGREAQMLSLVAQLCDEVAEIQRRIREEQKHEGY
jgi:hypothetical protein